MTSEELINDEKARKSYRVVSRRFIFLRVPAVTVEEKEQRESIKTKD